MTIHLSCGHEAEDGCLGVCVEYADEQCVAGEGFVPCTVEAVYCHKCAMDLAAAEERAKIVAYLRETFGFDSDAADAIEAKEHLK
jgi:hypothetical protein